MPEPYRYLGIDWLKNAGSQDELLPYKLDSQIMVHSSGKKGMLWALIQPEQLLKLLKKDYAVYEVISHFPHKVYFDIDLPELNSEPDLFLDAIKQIITEFFPMADMAISGSITERKTSYHIVLQNYLIRTKDDRNTVKGIVKLMSDINSAFDWKVYTKNRNMKCINQSKSDGRVQEVISNIDYKAHCITCFINETTNTIPVHIPVRFAETIEIAKANQPFVITSLPKIDLSYVGDKGYMDLTAMEILQLLPITPAHDHVYTHRVARFCYSNNICIPEGSQRATSLEVFLQWIRHKHIASKWDEVISKWTHHWSRIDRFPEVPMSQIRPILYYYYADIKKDRSFRKFELTFNIDTYPTAKIDTLAPEHFMGPEKYKIFNIGMGGGKTAQTVQYLTPTSNFCWIAPNRALAYNTMNRLQANNLNVTYYSSLSTVDKQAGALNRVDNLLIVANSLHYITTRKFHEIVIDEIETLIDKWFGTFMKCKKQNWNIFKRLLRSANRVILLDAFITTKTINLIKAIDPDGDLCIYVRKTENITRTVNYMSGYKIMVKNIIDDLNAGLKLFIFYPYKKESNLIIEKSCVISMEMLYNLITEQTGKSGIYYNADIDEPIKMGLRDVNNAWADKSFIITNSVITCGVNYDRSPNGSLQGDSMDFDKEYLMISSFSTPRDIIQVSYRPRHLTTNRINIGYMGRMNPSSAWETDIYEIGCPIYTDMINTILVEKKSPIRQSVELFCEKAHYHQQHDTDKLTEELDEEITTMIEGCSVPSVHIQDVVFNDCKILETKIFKGTATMVDKLTVQKFYFTQQFVVDTPYEFLETLWNNRLIKFTQQYISHTNNPNSVFKKIQALNHMTSIFSLENIHKTKINEEIRTQIFKEYVFKNLSITSATISILVNIYNTFFGTFILLPVYLENKHVKYIIDSSFVGYGAGIDEFARKPYTNPDESIPI